VEFRQPDLKLNCVMRMRAEDNVSGDDVICLIGRDILHDLHFSMTFDGREGAYSLRWRE